jgi:hypothetical protein
LVPFRITLQPFSDILLLDLQFLANTFVVRELVHKVFCVPLAMQDLEACLALKPWADENHHRIYHDAVDAGIVTGMLSQDGLESGEGRGCTELLLSQLTSSPGWVPNPATRGERHT